MVFASECPENFIEINDGCYDKKNLDVLQDFIDANESLRDLKPQNIGSQEWIDGKLTYLYLGDHLLTTLPDSIIKLSNLTTLGLYDTDLTTVPEGVSSLSNLKVLVLSENNLTSLPESIGSLSSLES